MSDDEKQRAELELLRNEVQQLRKQLQPVTDKARLEGYAGLIILYLAGAVALGLIIWSVIKSLLAR